MAPSGPERIDGMIAPAGIEENKPAAFVAVEAGNNPFLAFLDSISLDWMMRNAILVVLAL